MPWPAVWEATLENNVGLYARLSPAEQQKLKGITRIMISEKSWEAHDGLEMSEEIQVTIAGSAALLALGVDDFYFDRVNTIIVFPQPVRRENQHGLVVGQRSSHSGEAWQGGQVVLSWRDVLRDARRPGDGRNLVIHEFAHCLDGLDGEMGGSLTFRDAALAARWKQVSAAEFESLAAAAERGAPTLLDPYGATNLAEFFAVCSETFFEQPLALKARHAALFELLIAYYHLDPSQWS